MSRLDNDFSFHSTISRMGGYGLTQDYLDSIVDKHFPIEESYKMSDALKFDGFYDPEDIYETSWNNY